MPSVSLFVGLLVCFILTSSMSALHQPSVSWLAFREPCPAVCGGFHGVACSVVSVSVSLLLPSPRNEQQPCDWTCFWMTSRPFQAMSMSQGDLRGGKHFPPRSGIVSSQRRMQQSSLGFCKDDVRSHPSLGAPAHLALQNLLRLTSPGPRGAGGERRHLNSFLFVL